LASTIDAAARDRRSVAGRRGRAARRFGLARRSAPLTLASSLAIVAALLVATPVASLLVLAAQPTAEVWSHLIAYVLSTALRDTALLLAGVGAVALLVGGGTAWLVSLYDFPGRRLLLWLLPMPLAIPTYVSAYVYVDLFEPLGLAHRLLTTWLPAQDAVRLLPGLRSLPGAIVLIGGVLYPYVYLSVRATLQHRSAELTEAARVLGAGPWQILRRIALPTVRPAFALGLALVCLETLNDIGASEYLGVRTLTVTIFTIWLNQGSLGGAAQMSCLMLMIVAGLVVLERYGRRRGSVALSAENPRIAARQRLRGLRGGLAAAACGVPPLLGFIVPLAFLAYQSAQRDLLAQAGAGLWRDALATLGFATLATLIALLLGLAAVLAHRWRPTRLQATAEAVAQAGYALPGLVLAIGLLIPVLALDNGLGAVSAMLGWSAPGLVIVSFGAAVVAAYVIRFLAVPTGLIKVGAGRIPRDYDDCAVVAGARPFAMLNRIHLPLLRPAMIGAVIIVFVDCLKELPATLLLRPLNVETLATSIYQYASRGSFEDGALAALLIVLASIGPVAWLTRDAASPSGPA